MDQPLMRVLAFQPSVLHCSMEASSACFDPFTTAVTRQQWHQFLRTAFRSHLFQFAGSYAMIVFFTVAPFNNDNLLVFRHFADEVLSEQVCNVLNIHRAPAIRHCAREQVLALGQLSAARLIVKSVEFLNGFNRNECADGFQKSLLLLR